MTRAASARVNMASRSGSAGVNVGAIFHFFAQRTRVSATDVRELTSRASVRTSADGLSRKHRDGRNVAIGGDRYPGDDGVVTA